MKEPAMSSKRVLLVSNRVMHYRVPVYNHFRAEFAKHGYDFSVCATELQNENPHRIGFPFSVLGNNFIRYRNHIARECPDFVILFLHLKDPFFFRLAHWLKLKGINTVFWTKGANLDDPDNILRRVAFSYTHLLFDGLLLYSRYEKRFVNPRFHHKIAVANNTLNQHSLAHSDEDVGTARAILGVKYKKIALFIGRMGVGGGRKKVDHAIEVFRRFDRSDWGLLIVGSGLSDASRHKLNPLNTQYLGEIHSDNGIDISRVMKAADIVLIPGHVGLGVNHAFFSGLPVITEEGRQPPEFHYIVNGRNGFIVPENDIDALTERVRHLLSDDVLRDRLSQNARLDAERNATVETMFAGFLSSIERLDVDRKETQGKMPITQE